MKILKKTAIILGGLVANTGNAFIVPPSKNLTIRNQSPKTTMVQSESESENSKNKMPKDDELFAEIFKEKSNNNLSDKKIHSGVNNYLYLAHQKYSLLLETQENMLNSLKDRINKFDTANMSLLLEKTRQKLTTTDTQISENDILLAMPHFNMDEDAINKVYINDDFISKFIKDEKIGENQPPYSKTATDIDKVADIVYGTRFDTEFSEKNQFLQERFGVLKLQDGGIIKGQYDNKEIYFLLSRTEDDQLRLINISEKKENLKTVQHCSEPYQSE